MNTLFGMCSAVWLNTPPLSIIIVPTETIRCATEQKRCDECDGKKKQRRGLLFLIFSHATQNLYNSKLYCWLNQKKKNGIKTECQREIIPQR